MTQFNRRQFIKLSGLIGCNLLVPENVLGTSSMIRKPVPKTGEMIPVIGLGTSRTFHIENDPDQLSQLVQVCQQFFDMGGSLIDSSPMYGSAEQAIGKILPKMNSNTSLFAATKVWIEGQQAGIRQMETSRKLWGVNQFDLMQIHNLVDWRTHLETLNTMKLNGQIRYIGLTTSHGRDHQQLISIMSSYSIDCVQISYNLIDREVESSVLPLAAKKGIAVIVNRPFQRGALFRKVNGLTVPKWIVGMGCDTWAQFFLKFIISHPAVTCVIPATSKREHLSENMLAGTGDLPNQKQRLKMIDFMESL
ncbi:MAG: aldo/keto reductase [Gammaproteobacteria bacterium]|nr:aldo/keto reductase [Gammaproteobacteria bacterium]